MSISESSIFNYKFLFFCFEEYQTTLRQDAVNERFSIKITTKK